MSRHLTLPSVGESVESKGFPPSIYTYLYTRISSIFPDYSPYLRHHG